MKCIAVIKDREDKESGTCSLRGDALARRSVSSDLRPTTMLFPIDDLLDDAACYRLLLSVLHRDGLHCPQGHVLEQGQALAVKRVYSS